MVSSCSRPGVVAASCVACTLVSADLLLLCLGLVLARGGIFVQCVVFGCLWDGAPCSVSWFIAGLPHGQLLGAELRV